MTTAMVTTSPTTAVPATTPTQAHPGLAVTPPWGRAIPMSQAREFANPEVLREERLVCNDPLHGISGANAFYCLYLEKAAIHSKQSGKPWLCYRVRAHHGAMNTKGTQWVYACQASRAVAERAFDQIVAAKTDPARMNPDGTKARIYVRAKTLPPADVAGIPTVAPVAGGRTVVVAPVAGAAAITAPTIVRTEVKHAKELVRAGHQAPASWHPKAKAMYDGLLRASTVQVQTAFQASGVTDAGLLTPMGVLRKAALEEARATLRAIGLAVARNDIVEVVKQNRAFFRLVPQALPVGHDVADAMFVKPVQIATEEAAIEAALNLIDQKANAEVPALTLEYTDDRTLLTKLTNLMRADSCQCHASVISGATAVEAYRITRPAEADAYNAYLAKHPKAMQRLVMHGAPESCLAGILTRGLLPTREAKAAGASGNGTNFGEGIYFASNYGKIKQYTYCDLILVATIAIARPHIHRGRAPSTFVRNVGTDGVWAQNDGGGVSDFTKLAHDEFVVADKCQAALCYLVKVR